MLANNVFKKMPLRNAADEALGTCVGARNDARG
jgi:hypothetical protein